jgi:predicted O-methyltransferase YrrM
MIAIALNAFTKYEVTNHVKLVEGPAAETLKTLRGTFDIIFIDADKPGYKTYFEIILEKGLLAKDGIIITDNSIPPFPLPLSTTSSSLSQVISSHPMHSPTPCHPLDIITPSSVRFCCPELTGIVLSRGLVVERSDKNPYSVQEGRYKMADAMQEFNDFVANEPKVEVVVLPLFDGLGLIRLKD